MLGYSPHDVAYECRCCLKTVYNYINNLLKYGSVKKPLVRTLGRPRTLTSADEEALFEMLVSEGWRMLDEIRFWLWCERNVKTRLSTISRTLKRKEWNKKKLYLIGRGRSEELREAWRLDMRRFTAEDLVFLDESIFNEKTGWRYRAYGPVGSETCYPANINRGYTSQTDRKCFGTYPLNICYMLSSCLNRPSTAAQMGSLLAEGSIGGFGSTKGASNHSIHLKRANQDLFK